ncbi:MAG: hypothetical protein WA755_08505 [Candidatus Acidiferrales bacterium]
MCVIFHREQHFLRIAYAEFDEFWRLVTVGVDIASPIRAEKSRTELFHYGKRGGDGAAIARELPAIQSGIAGRFSKSP